jgi:hypothetical protein
VATEHRLPLWAEGQEAQQGRVRGRVGVARPAPEEVEQGQEVVRASSLHITSRLLLHERAGQETVGVRHRVTVAARGEVEVESHMPHRHRSRHQVTVRHQAGDHGGVGVLVVRAAEADGVGAVAEGEVATAVVQEVDARI